MKSQDDVLTYDTTAVTYSLTSSLDISDDILGGHEQRVDVLESLELCLIDLADDAGIVRRQLHRLVRELGREIRQVRVRFQPGKSR
jgi:hypothetical protein